MTDPNDKAEPVVVLEEQGSFGCHFAGVTDDAVFSSCPEVEAKAVREDETPSTPPAEERV